MGLKVEIMLPLKYYKEQIAKAKKAGDMKKVKELEKDLRQREREINKQESMDRNARANAADLKAGSAMGGANAPKPRSKPMKPPKPMKKPEMMYGGMANNKKHMYAAGGSVKDTPGLKALKGSGSKGMEAYKKITGRNV
tara:strand:+ start:81 stop:497 length:417 start_codon:yes stop_codon:yes gene_type:complete